MNKIGSAQRVSNIALPQAQHKATSPTRKTLSFSLKKQNQKRTQVIFTIFENKK
jgi:hypothetical protein